MSSSGIIYAVIVGAWAVYLVPMWLRREDELNRARQTQRYAAAIKVLANKEAFERRWAQSNEADEALPLAAGQGPVPAPTSAPRTAKRAAGKDATASRATRGASSAAAKPATKPAKRPIAATAATAAHNAVTANIAPDTRSTRTARPRATATPVATTAAATQRRSTTPGLKAPVTRTRTGLMARRRRVVALLFAVSTLGALVSADLGAGYLWVMAFPAVLLSAYIARLRREERIRAAAQAAKYAAAQEAREAREAEFARAEAVEAEAARLEAEEAEALRAHARTEAELRRRTEAARRRSSAAARARAQAFTHEAPDLRQASNG
jgi:hypothetical protein